MGPGSAHRGADFPDLPQEREVANTVERVDRAERVSIGAQRLRALGGEWGGQRHCRWQAPTAAMGSDWEVKDSRGMG